MEHCFGGVWTSDGIATDVQASAWMGCTVTLHAMFNSTFIGVSEQLRVLCFCGELVVVDILRLSGLDLAWQLGPLLEVLPLCKEVSRKH